MLYIFDRKENLLEILNEEDYSDFKHLTKVNSSDSLSFSTSKKKNIKKNNKVGFFKDEKFQLFLIYDFNDTISLDENKIDIECISDFNSLGNFIIEDKRVVDGTLREAAQKALEGMDYQVGITEEFELRNINFYFISRLKALNDILDTFKAEFDVRIEIDDITGRITNKYIDFKHRLGEDTGLRFTFDTNLKSIEKSPVGDHFNVLYGRGKSLETDNGGFSRKLDFAEVNNGKKYVEDLQSISKYGRLEGIFSDENIEDKRELLNKTLDKLQEVKDPKFTYKVTLEYLNTLEGFEHYKCHKGDTIIIIDEEEDLILEARILEIEETEDIIITLGSVQVGLVESDFESEIGDLKDKVDILDNNKPTIDNIYPDTLPDVPILKVKALYSSVILDWSYSNKEYYTYELFASKTKDFNPTSDNRIFEGKASSFLHEVKAAETWYYRVRAKNTYGKTTLFSSQIKAITCKISDSAEIFEEAAIGHAIIKDLDMDKATVGKLKGQFIEARNLEVIDGNDNRTLYVDSFGRVYLDVTSFSLNSTDIEEILGEKVSQAELKVKADEILNKVISETDTNNLLPNGAFEDGLNGYEGWKADLSVQSGVMTINAHDDASDYGFITPRFNLEANNYYSLSFDANSYYNTLKLNYCYLMDTQYGNIRLDSNIQLDPLGATTRVKITFKTSDRYKNIRLLIGYEGIIDSNTGFRVANLMLSKGESIREYSPKLAPYTEVEMRLRPNSIIQNINRGLSDGDKISVAGTVLDENGFSQLNDEKLSIRLNNNGVHVYSFLNEGKINGSIQALRRTATNDDIISLSHTGNSFSSITFQSQTDETQYGDYFLFDIYGVVSSTPITMYQPINITGKPIYFDRDKQSGLSMFGGQGSNGGYVALWSPHMQIVDSGTENYILSLKSSQSQMYSDFLCRKSLQVLGNKNCIQQTKYGDIPFYSNEDSNSLLTDTEIDTYLETKAMNGKFLCKVEIDEIIQECINTNLPYNVYIDKKDFGDWKVDIKEPTYFIVESKEPIKFKYKIEGRRRNFEKESKINNFMRKMTVNLPLTDILDKPIISKEKTNFYKAR